MSSSNLSSAVEKELTEIISAETVVDLERLRDISNFDGIPAKMRKAVWPYLLNIFTADKSIEQTKKKKMIETWMETTESTTLWLRRDIQQFRSKDSKLMEKIITLYYRQQVINFSQPYMQANSSSTTTATEGNGVVSLPSSSSSNNLVLVSTLIVGGGGVNGGVTSSLNQLSTELYDDLLVSNNGWGSHEQQQQQQQRLQHNPKILYLLEPFLHVFDTDYEIYYCFSYFGYFL